MLYGQCPQICPRDLKLSLISKEYISSTTYASCLKVDFAHFFTGQNKPYLHVGDYRQWFRFSLYLNLHYVFLLVTLPSEVISIHTQLCVKNVLLSIDTVELVYKSYRHHVNILLCTGDSYVKYSLVTYIRAGFSTEGSYNRATLIKLNLIQLILISGNNHLSKRTTSKQWLVSVKGIVFFLYVLFAFILKY